MNIEAKRKWLRREIDDAKLAAAWAAERDWQNAELTRMLEEAMMSALGQGDARNFTVIGNIYENPELVASPISDEPK